MSPNPNSGPNGVNMVLLRFFIDRFRQNQTRKAASDMKTSPPMTPPATATVVCVLMPLSLEVVDNAVAPELAIEPVATASPAALPPVAVPIVVINAGFTAVAVSSASVVCDPTRVVVGTILSSVSVLPSSASSVAGKTVADATEGVVGVVSASCVEVGRKVEVASDVDARAGAAACACAWVVVWGMGTELVVLVLVLVS
jgi:hypothetical protein